MVDDQTVREILEHGPPLRGQPLSVPDAAKKISEIKGASVSPVTVRFGVRAYRKRITEEITRARAEGTLDEPMLARILARQHHPNGWEQRELRGRWSTMRHTHLGDAPFTYFVDDDGEQLTTFEVNLPPRAGEQTGRGSGRGPGRYVGIEDSRSTRSKARAKAGRDAVQATPTRKTSAKTGKRSERAEQAHARPA